MSHQVYLALGSNLGVRQANLRQAIHRLSPQVRVTALSPVYETEPWGYADQPAFLNQCLAAETELSPSALLAHLKSIEIAIGRAPSFRYGPRAIDLDLIFYDRAVLDLPDLQVPHPHMAQRSFVLAPLNDLAPDFLHPVLNQSVRRLAEMAGAQGVRPYKRLAFGERTYVMGVLNITPDSFSGDGLLQNKLPLEAALVQARLFIKAGASILDIGGESTRPGSQPVGEAEELARVLPVLKVLAEETSAILSVDTSKARVAEQCLLAGADWINDVWGLRADRRMAAVAARFGAPVVLMHNRSKPANADLSERLGGRYVGMQYADLLSEVKAELLESVELARAAGVKPENIILDPGIGFGKTVEQNLELIDRLGEIKQLGYPLLLGPSRKSFIGYTLDLPPAERVEGTAAACVVGILRGADILRVHDVQPIARAARMTDAIARRHPAHD